MNKELSPETLTRIEREAKEAYPEELLIPFYQRKGYISCAKEYEAKLMDMKTSYERLNVEIADLKSALQAEEFSHSLSKERIKELEELIGKAHHAGYNNYEKFSQPLSWQQFLNENNL